MSKSEQAKETWRDWLPSGAPEPSLAELLTRAQILDWLDRRRMRQNSDFDRPNRGCWGLKWGPYADNSGKS